MSTTTKPSTTTSDAEECTCGIITSVCIGMAVIVHLLFLELNSGQPVHIPVDKNLTVAVESTAVRFYNATPDGRVCTIVRLGIRDGHPLNLTSLTLLVKKGDDTIADGVLPDVFNLTAGSGELVHGEAYGLVPLSDRYGQVHLDAELVEAVRADLVAGEGTVKVILNGRLGKKTWLDVICEDVVIDCSGRSAARVQKVDCHLEGYPYFL